MTNEASSESLGYFRVVEKRLGRDFANDSEMHEAGLAMLNYLENTPPSDSNSLTFGAIRNLIKRRSQVKLNDEQLMSITGYFVGGRIRLLDICYHFYDDITGQYYDLSKKIMKQALAVGELHHPLTDDVIPNFENQLIITYKPSELSNSSFMKSKERE